MGHRPQSERAGPGRGRRRQLRAAQSRFRETLDLLRETGDRRGEAHSLHRLAILSCATPATSRSRWSLARESYRLYSEIGDRAGMAWSSQILAECLNFAGFSEEALELLRTAERRWLTDLGDSRVWPISARSRHFVLGHIGQIQEAHVKGETGLALARRMNQPIRVAWCQIVLASLDLRAGEVEAAASRLQESEQLIETSARGHEMAVVYALQAGVALAQGERLACLPTYVGIPATQFATPGFPDLLGVASVGLAPGGSRACRGSCHRFWTSAKMAGLRFGHESER